MERLFITTILICSCLIGPSLLAQTAESEQPEFPKLDMSPMDIATATTEDGETVARVLYGRPQMRGREVFGKLVPYGEVWRTGANEASELTLYRDMIVGGETIEAGSYSFYTIPEENQWTIILNKSINTWGAYDYHVENDRVRIKVPVRRLEHQLETLSMLFETSEDSVTLKLGWDDRFVQVPFRYAD